LYRASNREALMVQSAMSVGTAIAESHSVNSAKQAQAPEKDFMSVLRNSAKSEAVRADNDRIVHKNDTTPSVRKDVQSDDKQISSDSDKQAVSQGSNTPADELAQIVAAMTAAAQQMVNAPQVKDASAMTAALMGQAGSGPAGPALTGAVLPAPNQNLNLNIPSAQTENGAYVNIFDALTRNAATAADKAADAKNSFMDMAGKSFQSDQANSAAGTAEDADAAAAQSNLEFSALIGKSSLAPKDSASFDETLLQIKGGALAGSTVRDANDSGGAASIYSQSALSVSSGKSSAPVQETIPANRLSAVEEVISRAVSSGQKDIVIRIDPPDMGNIHIRLSLDNGVLKADVRVDSNAVKDTFMAALPQIRTALETSGIKASQFSLDVRDDRSSDGQAGNNQNRQQKQEGQAKNAFSDFFA
jgi:flagellar hook-length control protein FliK